MVEESQCSCDGVRATPARAAETVNLGLVCGRELSLGGSILASRECLTAGVMDGGALATSLGGPRRTLDDVSRRLLRTGTLVAILGGEFL